MTQIIPPEEFTGKRMLPVQLLHQRSKSETTSSVIKRKFGSEIKSYHDIMKEKEPLYRALAYNCHRMTIISCLSSMISR
ncbi:MAG TPA: hypothetical protein VGA92_03520 [Candidatus Nitrosotenuis sp.]